MPMLVYWSVIFEAFISIVYSPSALRLLKTREKHNPNHRGLSQLPTDQVGQSSFRGAFIGVSTGDSWENTCAEHGGDKNTFKRKV